MSEEQKPFEVGDVVRSTGSGEVTNVGYNQTTIRITEHPDPSVVGRTYSAPHSHFQKLNEDCMETPDTTTVNPGDCWFCRKDDSDEPLYYDGEFETDVHISCIKRELEAGNPEAKHMEYLIPIAEHKAPALTSVHPALTSVQEEKKPGFFKRLFGGKEK